MSNEKKYYKYIDNLRIVLCILVFLYHLGIIKGGFLAVCSFFVLSGYLSSISALRSNKFSIKDYYLNRLKKIYAPLLVIVFPTIILARLNSNIVWMNLKPESISVLLGYSNFWQLKVNLDYFTKNVNSPFIHLWYISILMQYELIFPLVFVLLQKANKKVGENFSTLVVGILLLASTILFIVMSVKIDIMHVYYNTFARSFSFICGVLFALLHFKYNFRLTEPLKNNRLIIFILSYIVLIACCILVSIEMAGYAFYMILTTFITIILIEHATMEANMYDKPNRFIKVFSDCTYLIYLVQYPVIFFVQQYLGNGVLKVLLVILFNLLISGLLNFIMTFKKYKYFNAFKKIVMIILMIYGCVIIFNEKDHTEEMKELENLLAENAKMIEERQENKEEQKTNNTEEENNEYNEDSNNNDNNDKDNDNNNDDKTSDEERDNNVEENDNKQNRSEEEIAEEVRNLPIVGIGDSVLLGASPELYEVFPNGYFDGKVSRTINKSKELITELENEGKVGNIIVISLANNGDYSDKVSKDYIEFLGDREIYWVNAVGADDPQFNDRFAKFASDYPNVHIIDWVEASKDHPDYFYGDGIHLKPEGSKLYAETIYNAIYNDYLDR